MGWIADLLKEIPLSANYKVALEAMEKENGSLKSEKTALKADTEILKSQIEYLRQEIQRRDDVIQKKESHDQRLEDVKEKILVSLSSGLMAEDKLAVATGQASSGPRLAIAAGAENAGNCS